jgi:hypothetical protein
MDATLPDCPLWSMLAMVRSLLLFSLSGNFANRWRLAPCARVPSMR